MKQIDQTYTIKASIPAVWKALTTASMAEEWGAGPAEFDPVEGGKFSYWGGDIHGINTKIVPGELLEQDWYGEDRPEHCYKVSFVLSQDDDTTTIHLIQADVPDDEAKDFEEGWKDYYFDPISELLET
jgi:uncharacterized protein YndB with AHSA1/START domain